METYKELQPEIHVVHAHPHVTPSINGHVTVSNSNNNLALRPGTFIVEGPLHDGQEVLMVVNHAHKRAMRVYLFDTTSLPRPLERHQHESYTLSLSPVAILPDKKPLPEDTGSMAYFGGPVSRETTSPAYL